MTQRNLATEITEDSEKLNHEKHETHERFLLLRLKKGEEIQRD